jgi:hypothetical protein
MTSSPLALKLALIVRYRECCFVSDDEIVFVPRGNLSMPGSLGQRDMAEL